MAEVRLRELFVHGKIYRQVIPWKGEFFVYDRRAYDEGLYPEMEINGVLINVRPVVITRGSGPEKVNKESEDYSRNLENAISRLRARDSAAVTQMNGFLVDGGQLTAMRYEWKKMPLETTIFGSEFGLQEWF